MLTSIFLSRFSCLVQLVSCTSLSKIMLQMDTIKASDNGYSAELFVVTFNHVKESADNGSKVHVLLVSFQ